MVVMSYLVVVSKSDRYVIDNRKSKIEIFHFNLHRYKVKNNRAEPCITIVVYCSI